VRRGARTQVIYKLTEQKAFAAQLKQPMQGLIKGRFLIGHIDHPGQARRRPGPPPADPAGSRPAPEFWAPVARPSQAAPARSGSHDSLRSCSSTGRVTQGLPKP
jgi:hypothetical protein